MKKNNMFKKILIILVIAVAGLIGYSFLFPSEDSHNSSSLSSLIKNGGFGQIEQDEVELKNTDILRILHSIESIQLDNDIFASQAFQKIQESRFFLSPPLRIGRENPFLPLGFDNVATTVIDTGGTNLIPQESTQDGSNTIIDDELDLDFDDIDFSDLNL